MSTRLLETGVELVRAEIAVAMARARQAVTRALAALLATVIAAALLQVVLVVAVLSPLLVRTLSPQTVWFAVSVPALLALVSLGGAVVAWVSLQRSFGRSAKAVVSSSDSAQTQESVRAREASNTAPALLRLKEERVHQ